MAGDAGKQVTAGIASFKAVANKPGQTPEEIQDFILNPYPPMPQVQHQ